MHRTLSLYLKDTTQPNTFSLLLTWKKCVLSQPKTHFVFSPASNPFPAVSSVHVALPQHAIICTCWKDPAVKGILLRVTYGSAEGPTCCGFSNCRLSHGRLPSGSAALRQHPPFSCPFILLFSYSLDSKYSVFFVTIHSATAKQALRKWYLYLFWMKIKWLKTLP